jgi:hypothetical protein
MRCIPSKRFASVRKAATRNENISYSIDIDIHGDTMHHSNLKRYHNIALNGTAQSNAYAKDLPLYILGEWKE